MRVLFVIDGLSGGGAERVVLTLAEEMASQGIEVTIASLRNEVSYPLPDGVSYLLIEDTNRGIFRKLREIPRRAEALDQAIDALGKDFDLVVSHLPKADRIVAASRKLNDAWYCLHCAISAADLQNKKGWKHWRKKRQILKNYNNKKLVTVSDSLQDDVRNIGVHPTALVTIYNPFDLQKIRALSQEFTAFENEKFLLHVGRFHAQKRHDRLLEAFHQSGYPGKLVLLGNGNEKIAAEIRRKCEQLSIADRVIFAGFTGNPYAFMRKADALVLSSDYEGFGNVLVEALACGTQVISTDCPYGPSEILTGPLAQGLSKLSSEDLANAIRRVLGNPVEITDHMLHRFTAKMSVSQYLSLSRF